MSQKQLLKLNPQLDGRANYIEPGEYINLDPAMTELYAQIPITAEQRAKSGKIYRYWQDSQIVRPSATNDFINNGFGSLFSIDSYNTDPIILNSQSSYATSDDWSALQFRTKGGFKNMIDQFFNPAPGGKNYNAQIGQNYDPLMSELEKYNHIDKLLTTNPEMARQVAQDWGFELKYNMSANPEQVYTIQILTPTEKRAIFAEEQRKSNRSFGEVLDEEGANFSTAMSVMSIPFASSGIGLPMAGLMNILALGGDGVSLLGKVIHGQADAWDYTLNVLNLAFDIGAYRSSAQSLKALDFDNLYTAGYDTLNRPYAYSHVAKSRISILKYNTVYDDLIMKNWDLRGNLYSGIPVAYNSLYKYFQINTNTIQKYPVGVYNDQ